MLKITDLVVAYGGIHALRGVSLAVPQGEIITLVGANGAGKSTLLHAISGLLRPKSGEILFRDTRLNALPAHAIVARGLVQVPEGRHIFPNLTVQENLELGAYRRRDAGVATSLAEVLARFPRLRERRRQPAGTLSGGEQQMLAIARALMSQPQLLLLDEPSMGLAPLLVREIFALIREINRTGTTILLVEQNAHMALSIAHYGYVLETGRIVLAGPAQELAANPQVQQAYLGGDI